MKKMSKLFIRLITVSTLIALLLSLTPPQNAVAATTYYHWENLFKNGNWASGIANANQMTYTEGQVIPHWFGVDSLTPGVTYGFYIQYDYYQKSSNACGWSGLAEWDNTLEPNKTPPANTIGVPNPTESLSFDSVGGFGNLHTSPNVQNVTLSGPTYSGILGSSNTSGYVEITFQVTDTNMAEFYWGLRLSLDEECFQGAKGAEGFTGGSLQTLITTSTTSATPKPGVTYNINSGSTQIMPSAIQPAISYGYKFNDLNGNGVWNDGEPVIKGWPVRVYKCTDDTCASKTYVSEVLTGEDGSYSSTPADADVGYYQVCEVEDPNWQRTFPATSNCGIPIYYTGIGFLTPVQNYGNWSPVDLEVIKTIYPPQYYDWNLPFKYSITIKNIGYDGTGFDMLADFPLDDILPLYLKAVNTPLPATSLTITPAGAATCSLPYDVFGAHLDCDVHGLDYLSSITLDFYVMLDPEYSFNTGDEIVNTVTIAGHNLTTCPSPNQFDSQVEMECANNIDVESFTYLPTSVTVYNFDAYPLFTDIQVTWQTMSELDVRGFNLYRTTDPESTNLTLLNSSLIDAVYPVDGGEYDFIDQTAEIGVTYFYELEVIYLDGQSEWLDTVSATLFNKVFLPMTVK